MIHVLNRKQLQKLIYKKSLIADGVFIISFHDGDKRGVNQLNLYPHVQFAVDDIEPKDAERGYNLFLPCHAEEILGRVSMLDRDIEIICQCEAGLSRSAGVALALYDIFKIPLAFDMKRKIPNMHIHNLIIKEYGKLF